MSYIPVNGTDNDESYIDLYPMNEKDESIRLANACSVLVHDLSHIIWLREVSCRMSEKEKEKEITLFSQEDNHSLLIYKCFQKQIRNLQKYSKLISKFREIESFMDDVEDNLEMENFSINTNLFIQMNQEATVLKKCKAYSLNMGSIMHRAMMKSFSDRQPVHATIMQTFKKDGILFSKNEVVEVTEMENETHWQVKKQDRHICSISPLFLKLHADTSEGRLIDKLLERMVNLLSQISNKYFDDILKKFNTNSDDFFEDYLNTVERITHFKKCLNENGVNIQDNWNKNFELLTRTCSLLEEPIYVQPKVHTKRFCVDDKESQLKLLLKFQIEVSDKNITNENRIEEILNFNFKSPYFK